MPFKVGDTVEWTSSNTRKRGQIVTILLAGQIPADAGRPQAGGGGSPRDHETYVVQGRKVCSAGEYGARAYYWPLVSLLRAVS